MMASSDELALLLRERLGLPDEVPVGGAVQPIVSWSLCSLQVLELLFVLDELAGRPVEVPPLLTASIADLYGAIIEFGG